MEDKTVIKLVGGIIGTIIILIFLMAAWPFVGIGTGQRGVVFNRFSGIENRILGEGMHFRIPFVESVTKMSVQTQATSFEEKGADSAGTQDSQTVDLKVTINWHLDPTQVNRIYQSVGDNDAVIKNVLNNNTQDAVKQAVSKYQALEVQKNRDVVAGNALALLQEKVARYHIIAENLSLTNINFSADFNTAVEQAQVAQQKAKQAEYTVTQVKNEAQAAIAKAQGEAEAQKLKQQTLTPLLVQQQLVEALKTGSIKLPNTLILGNGQSLSQFILNLNTSN